MCICSNKRCLSASTGRTLVSGHALLSHVRDGQTKLSKHAAAKTVLLPPSHAKGIRLGAQCRNARIPVIQAPGRSAVVNCKRKAPPSMRPGASCWERTAAMRASQLSRLPAAPP